MASIEFLVLGSVFLWVELTFYEIVLFSQKLKYFELIWMKISWNTLTLVLHRYAILSLVELKFWMKNPWVSTGNCTGNSVGAVRGLAAARMLFLPGRSAWYRLGIFRVNSQPLRMKFLCVEFEVLDCSLSPWMNDWNRSGESAGCLKN